MLHSLIGTNNGYANDANLMNYSTFNSILFLSDGVGHPFQMSYAYELAKAFPGKKIISTDFNIEEEEAFNNARFMKMDNTKKFPFNDNEFDNIVMRRGLCVCSPNGPCCGGPSPKSRKMKEFFEEVVRVLDKNNPQSIAILHGVSNTGIDNISSTWKTYWFGIFTEIEKKYPVRVKFLETERSLSGKVEFSSIEISII